MAAVWIVTFELSSTTMLQRYNSKPVQYAFGYIWIHLDTCVCVLLLCCAFSWFSNLYVKKNNLTTSKTNVPSRVGGEQSGAKRTAGLNSKLHVKVSVFKLATFRWYGIKSCCVCVSSCFTLAVFCFSKLWLNCQATIEVVKTERLSITKSIPHSVLHLKMCHIRPIVALYFSQFSQKASKVITIKRHRFLMLFVLKCCVFVCLCAAPPRSRLAGHCSRKRGLLS